PVRSHFPGENRGSVRDQIAIRLEPRASLLGREPRPAPDHHLGRQLQPERKKPRLVWPGQLRIATTCTLAPTLYELPCRRPAWNIDPQSRPTVQLGYCRQPHAVAREFFPRAAATRSP